MCFYLSVDKMFAKNFYYNIVQHRKTTLTAASEMIVVESS